MSNTRLQGFKSFLTEQFTALAVEVFDEVENMVEACFEENKRLRSMLHMVLSPEIKLPRIDVSRYSEAPACIREQPVEPNTRSDLEISEPVIKRLKEEQTECEVTWSSARQPWPGETNHGDVPDHVKPDPEEDEAHMSPVTDSFNAEMAEYDQDSSATISDLDTKLMSDEAQSSSSLLQSKVDMSSSQKRQTSPKATNKSKSKLPRQKTLLQMPRMRVHKSFSLCPAEQKSFITRIYEAFKDLPDDQRPLITKMGLNTNVKMVNCAFGEVPVGSPLSYQCPLPTDLDYRPYENAPPQPPLPLRSYSLEPASFLPTLSAKEHEHLKAMIVSWEEAHDLERSTRGCKEAAQKSLKMRLSSRFRDITKLKAGRSHAEHLLFKIKKGNPTSKILDCQAVEEELKPEALREYCRHLCINWSPCGLVIHPSAPWLGATPDGVVYDPKEKSSYGLVHIKYAGVQSVSECRFLLRRNGAVQLKRAHQYYWQIQGQMLVTGMTWCDLLVHSRTVVLVQRIYRNESVIKSMKRKLDEFFFYYYLPNLD